MKNDIFLLLILLLLSCNNRGQDINIFDKIPLDTTKWCVTDTFKMDLNKDGIDDAILVFDKYKGFVRPDSIQTPIIFYLGTQLKNFTFLCKAEKIIFLPFEIKSLNNNTLVIIQKGIKNDRNIYTNYYKFENNSIVLIKEVIVQKISKSEIDENTGEVITKYIKLDTLINRTVKNIPVDKYDFRTMYQKYMND